MPAAGGHPLPGWMPIRWSWNGGQPGLDWCELGDRRLTEPFFSETAREAQAQHPDTRQTSAEVLSQIPSTGPGAGPSGFIFHLSRCGSTLAAQALAALPQHIVLSEPETIDSVLRTSVTLREVTAAMRIAWLRGLARAYGWPRFSREERFFIKFDAWHILFFDLIREAFPGVPWIFLYRDPLEVLVSQHLARSGRMLPGPLGATLLGAPLIEVLQMTPDEFCARALGRIAACAIDAATRDPLGRLINYSRLPDAIEAVLAPWFGLVLSNQDRERMRKVYGFHAKFPGQPFVGDSVRKKSLVPDGLKKLADHWVEPAVAQLEEIRRARDHPGNHDSGGAQYHCRPQRGSSAWFPASGTRPEDREGE